MKTILVCDDDSVFNLTMQYCTKGKYHCLVCTDTDEALSLIQSRQIDLLLLDIKIRSNDEGMSFIPIVRKLQPDLGIVVISGSTEFSTVRQAMKLGAWDYIPKSFNEEELLHTLDQALEKRALLQESARQRIEVEEHHKKFQLVGESKYLKTLTKTIDQIKKSGSNTIITGETGTGKDLVARLLRKRFADGSLEPFVVVDCSMLGVSGSEYLLFGEQRTIGTNERRSMKGAFELADGGTVFFDEITNMPMDIQGMLLRVLQEKETTRLGTLQPIQVNFRVVSSTRHDLEALVREKKFSQELYQRLNVIPIYLKPLKDHLEDVPSLVSYFVQKLPRPFTEIKFTPNAFQVLASYPWPGNVRELSNLVGYISTLADITREIDVSELPPQIRQYEKQLFGRPRQSAQDHESRIKNSKSVNFYESVARFEKDILKAEFEKAKGNISRMAMNIGIDRSYLYTKLREHKLYDNKKSSES